MIRGNQLRFDDVVLCSIAGNRTDFTDVLLNFFAAMKIYLMYKATSKASRISLYAMENTMDSKEKLSDEAISL